MKSYFLNEILCYCFTGLLLLTNTNCSKNNDFQKINFDFSKDYIAELAHGFKPKFEYDYWACLRSGLPDVNSISILYETNDLYTIDSFKLLSKGFYKQGHHSDKSYYIVTINNGVTNYITDVDEFIEFLGEIDTMEEALMIAIINGFGVDSNDPRGASYRYTDNKFEFLLMQGKPLPQIAFRQYFVSVDKHGILKSEARSVYCKGYQDCYEN